jgi:hypothetical protein
MDMSQDRIGGLVANPSESLNVEIKRWIDPMTPDGAAKIAKAAIALRNRNGGYFVVGFDDGTLQPDPSRPDDVRTAFHIDVVQLIVSKYASTPFEVQVAFAERDGHEYPVIAIPEGVTTPVAAKRDLIVGSKTLIREDAVYFRTLGSNGTPSTSVIKAADWRELMDICFDNREADIGRFLRRQLGIEGATRFLSMVTGVETQGRASETLESRTRALLQASQQHFTRAISKRQLSEKERAALQLGSWEVALLIDPSKDFSDSSSEFLSRVSSANPRYTGWPAWLVSSNFRNPADRSYKYEGAWEELVISIGEGTYGHFDFYRMHAKGEFYQWRILQDDLTDKVKPKTALEPTLVLYRVAEAIAVGLSLAKALEYDEKSTLGFMFKWNGLTGRHLEAWARSSYFSEGRRAHQDTAEGYVEVPLDTPENAIAPYVQQATKNLFSAFDGFEFATQSIEQWVTKLLTRS